MLLLRSGVIVALIGLSIGANNRTQAQELDGSLKKLGLDHGVFLHYPSNWSVPTKEFKNATELVVTTAYADVVRPLARTLVTVERLTDHAAVVRRLANIAAEVVAAPEYRVIGGWPAFERRYAAPLGEPGQRLGVSAEELTLRLTTAIAAGNVLVRLETVLFGDKRTTIARELQERAAEQTIAIGRSVAASKPGVPEHAQKQIDFLRAIPRAAPTLSRSAPPGTLEVSNRLAASSGQKSVAVPLEFGELEIAASKNGQHVVIAGNSGYAYSHNFGKTFARRPIPLPFKPKGDPTVAVGRSGTFYVGYVALPDGTVAAGHVSGCSISISKSVNKGTDFNFLSHAAFCPRTASRLCFPDQGHIAADRTNAGVGGADQLYLAYRNCPGDPKHPAIACEDTLKWCRGQPSIVCSKDGGETWGSPRVIKGDNAGTLPVLVENSGAADFARVAVGQDGVVYVIFRNGNLLQLVKYSSCSSGLKKLGETITIPVPNMRGCADEELIDKCHCPVAGLDRCNNGNLLSSPMVAVDDEDASRIYVAYALNTADAKGGTYANDDIVVQMSTDRGATWRRRAVVSRRMPGRRFMPWVCSLHGRAYVTWYDRRAATAADNDLTDYYMGSVHFQNGIFQAGPEINLSDNPDPQCGPPGTAHPSNWPKAPRSRDDAMSCSRQPQLAGVCLNGGSRCNLKCDSSGKPCSGSCPMVDDTCEINGGQPKYGDYNGNFCSAGRIFAAWASATAPKQLSPSAAGIRIYSAAIPERRPSRRLRMLSRQ